MAMNISQEGMDVHKRFFEAIDALIANKTIRGFKTFTTMTNINYWNLFESRRDASTHAIKVEWLNYMCNQFNVSAEWLILGKGEMFKTAMEAVTPDNPCKYCSIAKEYESNKKEG